MDRVSRRHTLQSCSDHMNERLTPGRDPDGRAPLLQLLQLVSVWAVCLLIDLLTKHLPVVTILLGQNQKNQTSLYKLQQMNHTQDINT